MQYLSLIGNYLVWHYTRGYYDLTENASNLFYFLYHFFSIPELMRTFFSPWKNFNEGHASVQTSAEYLSLITINSILWIVGIILRSIVIATGLVLLIISGGLTLLAFLLWTFIPGVIVFSFITGLSLLFI